MYRDARQGYNPVVEVWAKDWGGKANTEEGLLLSSVLLSSLYIYIYIYIHACINEQKQQHTTQSTS